MVRPLKDETVKPFISSCGGAYQGPRRGLGDWVMVACIPGESCMSLRARVIDKGFTEHGARNMGRLFTEGVQYCMYSSGETRYSQAWPVA